MSLKVIELQIAIPKTFDAGKVAEQKQQQSQMNQDLANSLTEKEQLKQRESVVKSETAAKAANQKTGGNSRQQEEGRHGKKDSNEQNSTEHPYKGAFVDFTG